MHTISFIKQRANAVAKAIALTVILINAISMPTMSSSMTSADTPNTVCQPSTVSTGSASDAPILLTPSNDSTNPNWFDFSWSSVSGASQYDWESSLTPELNADGGFVSQLSYHRLNTTYINEGGSPNGTYFWHVRAVGSDGSLGNWSQTWKSTISNAQSSYLSAPALLSPSNGAKCNIYDQDFDFMWTAPSADGGLSPLKYIFQSGKTANVDPVYGDFTDQPWTDTDIPTTHIFDGGSPNGTYFWHVRAVGSDGSLGPWSATWVVTISREAPAPVIIPPTDPPVQNPGGTDTSPVNPVAVPLISATPVTTTSVPNLVIPPSADIASVLGTTKSTQPNKPSPSKASKKANLAADISVTDSGRFASKLAWAAGIVLALLAAIFAYRRTQTTTK